MPIINYEATPIYLRKMYWDKPFSEKPLTFNMFFCCELQLEHAQFHITRTSTSREMQRGKDEHVGKRFQAINQPSFFVSVLWEK